MDGKARGGHPIRVVIADDEPTVVEYLRIALDVEGDEFHVVGIATDAGSAVDLVHTVEPDVLLLDLHMPGGGARAAQIVSSLTPATHVLVFTADADGTELMELLRSGIAGYLTKTASSEEIVAAVRAVAEGRSSFVPDIAARAVSELTTRLHSERGDELRAEQVRNRIERTIRTRAFAIVCQPIVDLLTGTVRGFEALSRFNGPPVRPPDEWFAEAGDVDLRVDLEVTAAGAALDLLDTLAEPIWLSINLSPATVLAGGAEGLLSGRDVSRVVLELTEHASVEDYDALNAALDPWRDRGLRIAVDDAGGGFASFAHVVHARADFIKLDRSLTIDIDIDARKQALAEAISGFATRTGADLIAEGIETPEQLDLLREVGAGFGQGYHLGRPAPIDQQAELACGVGRVALPPPRLP